MKYLFLFLLSVCLADYSNAQSNPESFSFNAAYEAGLYEEAFGQSFGGLKVSDMLAHYDAREGVLRMTNVGTQYTFVCTVDFSNTGSTKRWVLKGEELGKVLVTITDGQGLFRWYPSEGKANNIMYYSY